MHTHFLERTEGRLAYDDQGRGPLVICLPSLGDLRAEYRLLRPYLLEAGYRVVTMDLRGHGESSTNWHDMSVAGLGSDVVALLQQLGEPAMLIGTSISASSVIWAATEAPELVTALVLIGGPFARPAMPPWLTKLLFTPLFSKPWGVAAWTRYYAHLYPASKPADFADYIEALGANLREPGRLRATRQLITTANPSIAERFPQVTQPSLVIMGSQDPDFKQPAVEASWIAEQLGGTAHIVDGAGHYPHAEMAEHTASALLQFLDNVTAKRGLHATQTTL